MNKHNSYIRKISKIIGVVICIILVLIFIMNVTIIIKSYMNPNKVIDFFGMKPFIVRTSSMEGTIDGGDLIVTKSVDPSELEVGDIISYKMEQSIITHRIIERTEIDGEPAFVTKGDANNTADDEPVTFKQVESVYLFRLPKMGSLAIYMQTPVGMLVFIGIPLCCFILFDIIKRKRQNEKEKAKENEMLAELDRLHSQLEEDNQNN